MQRFHHIDSKSVLDRLLDYCREEMARASDQVMLGAVPPPPETSERIARYKTLAGVLEAHHQLTTEKDD